MRGILVKQNCYSMLKEDLEDTIDYLLGAIAEYFECKNYSYWCINDAVDRLKMDKKRVPYSELLKVDKHKKVVKEKDIDKIKNKNKGILDMFRKEVSDGDI